MDTHRIRVHGVLCRRVLPPDPRVAGDDIEDHRVGHRSARAGVVYPQENRHPVHVNGFGASQRCGQYTSLAFTEALIASGIAGSIGSVGHCPRQRLMESTIGLYKTKLIDRDASWSGRPRWSGKPSSGFAGSARSGCTRRSTISRRPGTRPAIVNSVPRLPQPPRWPELESPLDPGRFRKTFDGADYISHKVDSMIRRGHHLVDQGCGRRREAM